MKKYRKKPVVIEAVIWTGINLKEIGKFTNNGFRYEEVCGGGHLLIIETLEGEHSATVGDYIIKGVQDEFYPCKPDIFELTYEEVPKDDLTPREDVVAPKYDKITEGYNPIKDK